MTWFIYIKRNANKTEVLQAVNILHAGFRNQKENKRFTRKTNYPACYLTFPLKLLRFSDNVSGAMKAGVPAVLESKASLPSNWLLTPKSAIFT